MLTNLFLAMYIHSYHIIVLLQLVILRFASITKCIALNSILYTCIFLKYTFVCSSRHIDASYINLMILIIHFFYNLLPLLISLASLGSYFVWLSVLWQVFCIFTSHIVACIVVHNWLKVVIPITFSFLNFFIIVLCINLSQYTFLSFFVAFSFIKSTSYVHIHWHMYIDFIP